MSETIRFDRKYVIIKVDDVQKNLTQEEVENLRHILHHISEIRKLTGKKDNTYLVINTNEPYAGQIAQILKDHGHYCQDEKQTDVIEVKLGGE